MKIINAEIEWYKDYDNYPSLRVLFDEEINYDQLRYEQKGNMYFAELGGYVSYYYYAKPDEGFGGRTFPIILKDGTKKDLIGPWSSSSDAMTSVGFPPSEEVIWTADPVVWKRGFTFYHGSITRSAFEGAIKKYCKDAELAKVPLTAPFCMETSDAQNTVIGGTQKIIGDQFKYIIVRKGMTAEQSQMFKRLQRQKETVKKLQTESLEAANSFRWGNDKFKTKNEHLLFLNQEWVAMINTNIDKYHLNKYLKKLSPFKV